MVFIIPKMTLILISTLLITTVTAAPAAAPTAIEFFPSDFKLPDIDYELSGLDSPAIDKQSKAANKIAKQMQAIQKKLDEFAQILDKRSEDPTMPPMAHECISECNEVIGAALDDISSTLESLELQDLDKANFDVTAVSTNVDTCSDCFAEMGDEDPLVRKIDDWVRGITDEALVSLEKASR